MTRPVEAEWRCGEALRSLLTGLRSRRRGEMPRPDDVEWRRREELRSLLTALRSRRGPNGAKRLRQDDAAILSGLSTRRYAALERGAVENPSPDLIENVARGWQI